MSRRQATLLLPAEDFFKSVATAASAAIVCAVCIYRRNLACFGILTVEEQADHLADILSHLLHLGSGKRIIFHILAVHNGVVKVLIFILKLFDLILRSLLALFSLLLILE